MMPSFNRQSGHLLLPVLMLLITLGSSWLVLRHTSRSPADIRTARQFALIREALIARAVSDANRPGSLPCPDWATDSDALGNHPGDGKADTLTRNDCPSYLGWLPWATLDLGEQTDAAGERLWYALAPELRDDDNAPPLNSEIRPALHVDRDSDIAAIVFAPGPALAGQQRPSRNPADYLDGGNAEGAYTRQPTSAAFNDQLLIITRRELMAAVEKRVTGEVLRCLAAHAAQSGRHAWPAPLAAAAGRGHYGSRFGQLPLTQPGNGPQADLQADMTRLDTLARALPDTLTPEIDRTALQQLTEHLTAMQAGADLLQAAAASVDNQAGGIVTALTAQDSRIAAATANGRISVSERSAVRTAGDTLLPTLDQLAGQLEDSGLDPLPVEIGQQASDIGLLKARYAASPDPATLAPLTERVAASVDLLSGGSTANPTLAPRLAAAQAAATSAYDALLAASDPALSRTALERTEQLTAALGELAAGIAGQRSNYPATPGNDNLTLSSLRSLTSRLRLQLNDFATAVTRTQAGLVPYADALRDATVDLLPWAKMLQGHAAAIAVAARKASNDKSDAPAAVYHRLTEALDSLTATGGTLAAVDAWLAAPTRSDRRSAAQTALTVTKQRLGELNPALVTLAAVLSSSTAEALPTVWRHRACGFLQTGSGRTGWWHANSWRDHLFYQIADSPAAAPPTLRVNGRGAWHLVVLAAGQALPGQNRTLRRSSDFLEGANAHAGRDGQGENPPVDFVQTPPDARFNDRLAFQ